MQATHLKRRKKIFEIIRPFPSSTHEKMTLHGGEIADETVIINYRPNGDKRRKIHSFYFKSFAKDGFHLEKVEERLTIACSVFADRRAGAPYPPE